MVGVQEGSGADYESNEGSPKETLGSAGEGQARLGATSVSNLREKIPTDTGYDIFRRLPFV